MGEDDDFVIENVEGYRSGKGRSFSYSEIVAMAMRRCIESGSKEMKEGYYNRKVDNKGNLTYVYVPDSRLEFIESVETLKMVLIREFDVEANKNINKLYGILRETFKAYCKLEEDEWNKLPKQVKIERQRKGMVFRKNILMQESFYYNSFLEEKVKIMRLIFSELIKLVKRRDDFREEIFEA